MNLTNHQLAKILLAQPEMKVMISVTDHTDWTDKVSISEDDIEVGDPVDDSGEGYNEERDENGNVTLGYDNEGNWVGPKVCILNFSLDNDGGEDE